MWCYVEDSECIRTGRLKTGLCSRHYGRLLRTGTLDPPAPLRDFESYYIVQPDGQWLWTGAFWPNGYGKSPQRFGSALAHKASWLIHRGPVAKGAQIDHVLHNLDGSCPGAAACLHRRDINPDHLELTTRSENQRRNWRRTGLCRNELHDLTLTENVRYMPNGTRICIPCYHEKCVRANVNRAK